MRCLACTKSWKMLLRKSRNFTPNEQLKQKYNKIKESNIYCKRREKRLRDKVYFAYDFKDTNYSFYTLDCIV